MYSKNNIAALRAEMAKQNLQGFFVPMDDEFQNEYVPPSSERLKWVSNFTGSFGYVVVLENKAGCFVDGRYTLQAISEVDKNLFEVCGLDDRQAPLPAITPYKWIEKNLSKGARFGIDPWLHTESQVAKIKWSVEEAGGELVLVESNPLDAAWVDRPQAPAEKAFLHPVEYAGQSFRDKLARVVKAMQGKADALALTSSDNICWLLNIRGNDIPYNPFVLSYALVYVGGKIDWFVDKRKVDVDVLMALLPEVNIKPFGDFQREFENMAKSGLTTWLDEASNPVQLRKIIERVGGKIYSAANPVILIQSLKNNVEIEGSRKAHIRDGVAMVRFLSRLDDLAELNNHDELSAQEMLYKLRSEGDLFKGLSFTTISGAGANGAIVHYHSKCETNRPLNSGPLYLVDSGAQYLDGTTDITRTIPSSAEINDEVKDRFTRVLKGHIQVAMAEFPEGTSGSAIDVKARAALKEVGLDYAHGTGHGVGSYLAVHEGPFGISPIGRGNLALMPNVIISNEPGYYKDGEYGIRIENLVLVKDTGKKDAEGKRILGFETLTLTPISLKLIKIELLTNEEKAWLNAYHQRVCETLLPLVEACDKAAAEFLVRSTMPI